MLESKNLFADVIENPTKTKDRYSESFGNFSIESKYLDVKQTSKSLGRSKKMESPFFTLICGVLAKILIP